MIVPNACQGFYNQQPVRGSCLRYFTFLKARTPVWVLAKIRYHNGIQAFFQFERWDWENFP